MKTTHLKIGIAVIAALSFFMSCTSADNSDKHQDHKQHEENVVEDNSSITATSNNDSFNAIYPHYLTLQEALVTEDAKKAKEAALLIEEAAEHLPANSKSIKTAAGEILASGTIEEQRANFSPMSDALINLAKAEGVSSGEFYIAHCPMAFNNQGANWLSPSKSIKNPYFGDKMLSCGTVEETLN
ncbi:DUF3347 domain-containing protein [Olivibacter sp. SDN3]|uniref:DUF3347 domain-containing protein n=1 Tax=Olivibacter sp. SDN3 TaxID=2764720 RepID=UPI00165190E1|nr:DUF3347 domain-containing protein [Olivibacter sp. SDN3]QNL49320.1 DUF3347 domain-containing protein [Olivibacter sp. SDN3]